MGLALPLTKHPDRTAGHMTPRAERGSWRVGAGSVLTHGQWVWVKPQDAEQGGGDCEGGDRGEDGRGEGRMESERLTLAVLRRLMPEKRPQEQGLGQDCAPWAMVDAGVTGDSHWGLGAPESSRPQSCVLGQEAPAGIPAASTAFPVSPHPTHPSIDSQQVTGQGARKGVKGLERCCLGQSWGDPARLAAGNSVHGSVSGP